MSETRLADYISVRGRFLEYAEIRLGGEMSSLPRSRTLPSAFSRSWTRTRVSERGQ